MADHDHDLVRAERDLYRRLLDLGDHDDLAAFLDEALALVVEATGALRGYLSLDPARDGQSVFTIAQGFDEADLAQVRRELSQGILAEALRTGRTVSTASALDDPRFRAMASVQANRILAVLCAPIGGRAPLGALYLQGRAAPGPFVEVNCAALPDTLLEAELFGAEKGAHSTATRRIPGRIAAAQGGTLFLDEIAELPLASQPKLLQFLQSRRYWRLGGESPVEADVRVIAATNVDLPEAVRTKRFREDLYYRLDILTVRAPALRERPDDVPILADRFASAAGASAGRDLTLSRAARTALRHAEWPGNVRQLSAAVQRGAAFALSEGSAVIEPRHLFPETPAAAAEKARATTWQEATRGFQRRLLDETLDACGGNVSEAARRLDVARSHLHELLRAHGINRPKA